MAKNAKSRHVGLVQDPVWVCDTVCDQETWYLQQLPFYKLTNSDILLENRLENEILGSNSGIELYKCLNKFDLIEYFSFRYVTDSEFNRLNEKGKMRLI